MIFEDQILVTKNWMGNGKWSLPGGGLHHGEEPAIGAVREVLEETGIKLKPASLKLLGQETSILNSHKDTLDLRKAPPSPDQLTSADSDLPSFDVATATSPSAKPLPNRADLAWERAILRKSSTGFKFRYIGFSIIMEQASTIRPRWFETVEARWIPVAELTERNAKEDLLYLLRFI
ncbi:NUDIX hydrolase [Candidatus Saccharibacteria bacterium]|nr:NUDIX hydrolase [Candidatus Saccharibacteria bacterium]MBI3338250.1 NUDIX hydrolase [Candidatus Saccharibacteria bacterium]